MPTPTTDWPPPSVVPPLLLRDATALPPSGLDELLRMLKNDLPESERAAMDFYPPQPWRREALPAPVRCAIDALRSRCTEHSLDAWMATLLRSWLSDIGTGTARKIRWVMPAAGLLGGDACVALIGAHMRGENHEMRCGGEIGVAAIQEIGTRGALLELAQLGRKFPSKSRGQYAQKALLVAAAAQGITPEQLQDRIFPDCGLDAAGRRSFDFGPRQFELVIDEYLAPVLRAADGRRITSLPKPTAKDDAGRAADAQSAWKIAKKQIQQSARMLAARFESALISGETWSTADFNNYFRGHPLARHVVRRLVWCTSSTGGSTICFRVAEDDSLADSQDSRIELPNAAVDIRLVHPLELDAEARATWQRLFAEYQIVAPFPQLERPLFQVTPDRASLSALPSFPHERVDVKALIFPLENRGWVRDPSGDGGMVTRHTRPFPKAGVVAVLDYEPGAFLGELLNSGTQVLTKLQFFRLGANVYTQPAMKLEEVPPIVFSETLRDIHSLVPAA